MKFLRKFVAVVCSCILFISTEAQEKWSKVKIYVPQDKAARASIIGALHIDHFDTDQNGSIITELAQSDLEILKSTATQFEMLVPDVAQQLDSLNQIYYSSLKKKQNNVLGRVAIEQPGSTIDQIIPKPTAFEVKAKFGGYYSFAEMEAAMNALVSSNSAIAQKISIGKTYENRDIWVIKISDNVATDETNEPEVLYLGLQHAREAITGASMIFYMQYLCEQYSKDSRIKNLVDNREIYIIPCFNPDGWEYNRTTATGVVDRAGGGWRKNRFPHGRIKGSDEFGIDLNRNWGVDWGNCNTPILGNALSCGSDDKADDTYFGANAFSELETQAVREFTKSRHIVAGFDQHAFGPYYSLPFGRQSLHKNEMPQKGKDFYTAIPALMGKYNGMRAADSYDALGYEVAGGFKDWMLMGELGSTSGTGKKDTVWAMTGEGGAGGGTGGSYGSFWAPASEIVNLCKGMTYQNLQLAFAAGTYVDIQDGSDMAMTQPSGTLTYKVKRLGLGNDPVKVTLVPLENMQAGGTYTIPSMVYYEDYTGAITYNLSSGISNGQRVSFAWKVETGGYTYSDTVVKFYNPSTLLSDDMEGSNVTSAWTVSGGWNYSTDTKFGGTKSLSESPGANYTISSTRIATNNNVLNLSGASAAYLTFWTKYRAENFRDKLQVQVSTNSTNGTDGTWTAIAGRNTIQEPGTVDGSTINGQPSLTGIQDYWSQEVFDLSNYKTTSSLRFRFMFTSDGDPTGFKYEVDEGFYIDNLKVIKTDANFAVLPVAFLNFTGKLLADNKVQLNWEAQMDEQHHYFEVERSGDGANFITLGKVTSTDHLQYIDKAPKSGNNFYRIKQFDKDGTSAYSKIINVVVEKRITLSVFPNPVHNELTIQLGSRQAHNYKIQLTDLQGKVLYEEIKNISNANGEINIDMRTWKRQLYILKIIGINNEVLQTQKIIKL